LPARATIVRARQHSVGLLMSSKVCRVVHDQRDFLECHTTDHLTKDRSMHLEGKTNGDARGREIATCATVGAEIQTCIRRLVRAWPLEPTRGEGPFLRDRREDCAGTITLFYNQFRSVTKPR